MAQAPITGAEAQVTQVRGSGMMHLRSTLKVALYGGRWETLLKRLTPPARAILEHPINLESWIDSSLLLEIHNAQQDLPHPDTRKVRGELMAEGELGRRGLLAEGPGTDPRSLILRLPFMWPETHRGGCVTIDTLQDGRGEMSIWAIFPYPEYFRDVAPAWLRQALSMAGAKDPRVDYLGPGPEDPDYRHRYWLRWEPMETPTAPSGPSPDGSPAAP